MRRILAGVLWAAMTSAQAAPFLVSDPWPASGAQPTSCVYQEGTAAEVASPIVRVSATDTRVYCRWDQANITRAAHTYQVWARNQWDKSTKVPFVYSASVPGAPTGMRITP